MTGWGWPGAALATALLVAVAASLPYWLPAAVVALRVRVFAWLNGDEGVQVPGPRVPVEEFKRAYGPAPSSASCGRNRTSGSAARPASACAIPWWAG